MLITIAALALLLQTPPTPPTTPTPRPPRVRVHAPEAPRTWRSSGRDRNDDEGLIRDTTFAVRQGQRLEVDNFSGSITVTAWNDDKVRVTARSSSDPFSVDVGSITVHVNTQAEDHGGPGDSELTIQVPAWMALEMSGNEVDIEASGTHADIKANTVQGHVTIDGGEGTIEAQSVEGDLTISNVKGRVDLSTVEGAVDLRNISGSELEVETVDGDIEMTGVSSTNISANSVDGDITWGGTLAPTGTYRFSTHDGDLRLGIMGDPDATVSVETFDGSLESDWPVTLRGTNQRKMTFTLGSGRARVELSSFDGTISLKRATSR